MTKFTLYTAAQEWNLSRENLKGKLAAADIAGDDGFTIAQINAAVFGDRQKQLLRKTTEEADKVALENALKRGDLVDLESFSMTLERPILAVKQFVKQLELAPELEDKILNGLADVFGDYSEILDANIQAARLTMASA